MKKNSIKLSEVTTYKFGGYCDNFFDVDDESINSEVNFNIKDQELFVLGKGSNLVFSDEGYKGTIVKPNINFIKLKDSNSILSLGASTYLPDIARFSKNNSIASLEWLIGIPGTVGGAVSMNAGAYGYEFADHIKSVKIYDIKSNKIQIKDKDYFEFSYRTAKNLDNKIILSVDLHVEKGNSQEIQKQISKNLKRRKDTQPAGVYNAGSVFKNPKEGSAGFFIENAGLKGFSIEGVEVSQKHANFFVARKGSKAQSLFELTNYVKNEVFNKFDITLEEEIIFVGNFS
ncbi:UDP-N-acetylmuramate dehydrogenase [Candidatus Actinomarina]|nr:UDP-N-acetylmuramate dehydrogenase [Candidatus Actinomarina sp.]